VPVVIVILEVPLKVTVDGLKYATKPDGGFVMLSATVPARAPDAVRVTVVDGTD